MERFNNTPSRCEDFEIGRLVTVLHDRQMAVCRVVRTTSRTVRVAFLEPTLTQKVGSQRSFKARDLYYTNTKPYWKEPRPAPEPQPETKRPCLVNVLTGEKTYGPPGMDPEVLFELKANGML